MLFHPLKFMAFATFLIPFFPSPPHEQVFSPENLNTKHFPVNFHLKYQTRCSVDECHMTMSTIRSFGNERWCFTSMCCFVSNICANFALLFFHLSLLLHRRWGGTWISNFPPTLQIFKNASKKKKKKSRRKIRKIFFFARETSNQWWGFDCSAWRPSTPFEKRIPSPHLLYFFVKPCKSCVTVESH